MNEEDDIVAAKQSIKASWLGRPGVTGLDVGFKYIDGNRTADVAIRLMVRKKLKDMAPEDQFPTSVGKHKTDVLEREFKPVNSHNPVNLQILPDTSYYPTMQGGVPLVANNTPGSPYASGVTAGMFVRDNYTGQLMILTTFHGNVAPNQPVYQPSGGENDANNGRIGYLIRGGHYLEQPIDADLVLFGAPRAFAFDIIGLLGSVQKVRTVGIHDLGMMVTKRGCTTGITSATLDGFAGSYPNRDYNGIVINYEHNLTFKVDPSAKHVFTNPFNQQPTFTLEGDSGSVIVDSTNRPVALLTAANGMNDANGHDIALGNFGYGPAISHIISSLNVTPCIEGMTFPKKITLTSIKTSLPTPMTMPNPWNNTPAVPLGDWGKFTSGVANVKPFPTCKAGTYKWTITNVYQSLVFQATVIGFDRPVFSWRINGQQVNSFNSSTDGFVSVSAVVSLDQPNSQHPLHPLLEAVNLNCNAQNTAQYNIDGTTASLSIFPPGVDEAHGHIFLTVEVDVRDISPTAPVSLQVGSATLDTQQFSWDTQYYIDQAKCANAAKALLGLERHPFTLIDLLLSQPNPPPDLVTGVQFMTQLNLELEALAREQPKSAEELLRIFSITLGVPQQWLSGRTTKSGERITES